MSDSEMNIFTDATGKSLGFRGYDPVAYFQQQAALAGSLEFTHVHDDVEYRFVDAANLKAFEGDPARYLPQYGGFCAFGISEGVKLDVDPAAFEVVNGKLYLNNCQAILTQWREMRSERIGKADAKWPELSQRNTEAA